jgi:WD40 repeat protein
MKHKRFLQILGISIIASLLVATVISIYGLVKSEIALRRDSYFCLPAPPTSPPPCYGQETILSQDAVTALATSADELLLASGTGNKIQVWNLKTLKPIRSLIGHRNWISALAFSPNGQLLASSSLDQTIRLWDLQTGTLMMTLYPRQVVTTLAFSPDGTTLASGSRLVTRNGVASQIPLQIWDLNSQRIQRSIQTGPINALAFSPDGQWLAAGAQDTKLWQLPEGRLTHTLRSHQLNALLFSLDSEILVTGSEGSQGEDGMNFWQVHSGTLSRTIDSVADDLALTADGKMLASTLGGIINLWRMKPLGYLGTLRGSQFSTMFVRFGLNGREIITGSSDGIRVWQEKKLGMKREEGRGKSYSRFHYQGLTTNDNEFACVPTLSAAG